MKALFPMFVLAIATLGLKDDPKPAAPTCCQVTDLEQRDLQLAQKDVTIADQRLELARANFIFAQQQQQAAHKQFQDAADRVKTSHKWDTAVFDETTLTFKPGPQPPSAAPLEKK